MIETARASKAMPKSTGKWGLLFFLRAALALILLLFLLSMIDLRATGQALSQLKPRFALVALALMLVNYCLKTYRWASILRIERPDISLGRLLRYNFASMFLGNLIPSSLAPDVMRVVYMSRRSVDPKTVISSIIADRILGNLSLAFLTLASVLLLKDTGFLPLGSLMFYGALGFLLFAIMIPLLLRNPAWANGLSRLLRPLAKSMKLTSISEIYQQLRSYGLHLRALSKSLAISFINVLIAVLEFYLIAHSLSTQISIGYFLLFIPLISFLSALPISIAGLGLLEASLVYFFSQVGMSLETCIASALIFRILQLICLLPGMAIYVTDGFFVKQLPA